MRLCLWFLALALTLLVSPRSALADRTAAPPTPKYTRGGGKPIYWSSSWQRVETGHFILGAGLILGTTAVVALGPDRDSSRPLQNDFDEGVRDSVRGNRAQRQQAEDISDILLTATSSYPFIGDAAITAAWYRDSPDVAWEMALVGAETYLVLGFVHASSNLIAARERPYGRECEEGGELDPLSSDCRTRNRFRSFFSGHSSFSFAGASLTCVHHLKLQILGGGAIEAVPCLVGYAAAATTAAMRVRADQHYFSDVFTGAFAGTAIGLGVPLLLHYRGQTGGSWSASRDSKETDRSHFSFMIMPMPTGIAAGGTF